MSDTTEGLTPEQLKAQADAAKAELKAKKEEEKRAAAAEKAAKKAEADAAKQAAKEAKAAAKAAKDAEAAAAKAQKEAEKQAKLEAAAALKAEKEAKKVAKIQEAEARKAAKEAARMPEQNGVRRPKPETLCGQAWAVFDEVSGANGTPASITDALPIALQRGLNEGNVRTEYARWKKFFGLEGRIAPLPKVAPATDGAQTAGE